MPPQASVVVRMHHRPIGAVTLRQATLDREKMAVRIEIAARVELASQIAEHLAQDGISNFDEKNLDRADLQSCRNPYLTHDADRPEVTVIMPTVDNEAQCLETIAYLLKSEYTAFNTIVIENTPRPTNLGLLIQQQFQGANIQVLHEPVKGCSRARNLGLQYVDTDYVIFIDDDVIVDPHWMTAIMAGFLSHREVACVTGAILPLEIETPAQSLLEQYGGYHKGYNSRLFDLHDHRDQSPLFPYAAGQFGSGANMAFRVADIRNLGGFCNELGAGVPAHGGEDIDLFRRVISSGGTLFYEPGAMVWHAHRKSYDALRLQMYRYGVGLSATLMKWMLEDRGVARDLMSRIPVGLKYLLNPHSEKNAHKKAEFPRELSLREILGFAMGPLHYLRSRRAVRRGWNHPRSV